MTRVTETCTTWLTLTFNAEEESVSEGEVLRTSIHAENKLRKDHDTLTKDRHSRATHRNDTNETQLHCNITLKCMAAHLITHC